MSDLKFALFGAGFWSRYQLAGWSEIAGAKCVAICNRTVSKAESLAHEFSIPAVYGDANELLRCEQLDFVDVATDVNTHSHLVKLAAGHGLPVICQKPMAPALEIAEDMVHFCHQVGVPLFINENWRWQTPIRELKRVLLSGEIGNPFRACLDMNSGFPVFQNQPFLRELKQFIITDLGSHILDVARFLFGEVERLYCETERVHTDIQGEDVATILLRMRSRCTVLVRMAYAETPMERECFPQTLIFVEGEKGSVELAEDYWMRTTTAAGTMSRRYPPRRYAWADPAYDVVHASIVPCQANLLEGIASGAAETTGEDNLKTARLVFASYDSARQLQSVSL